VKTIYRVEKNQNYSVISNAMAHDARLSFAARGLLTYLLTLPDNWTINTEHLIKQSPLRRDGVKKLLRELESFKYLRRERARAEHGRMGAILITIFESPDLNGSEITSISQTISTSDGFSVDGRPQAESPATAPPQTALPSLVKPQLLNTNQKTNTNRATNTKETCMSTSNGGFDSAIKQVFQYWQQIMNKPDAILDDRRKYFITARLKEGRTFPDFGRAIRGCRASSYHRGDNDSGTVFDDISLICKDAEHFERFMETVDYSEPMRAAR
jgi:hypothetical protein